jgi:hypothetical protein
VHETAEDLQRLQTLLDESYASAGEHLLSIHTPKRRLKARKLCTLLTGVRVLALATVTADGRPIAGPVDGLFYRGSFFFGSSPESVRFKHLRVRTDVSAVHTVGEELAVTVHGRVREIDVREAGNEGYLGYLREIYPDWDSWWPAPRTPPYAVIEPRRMFAFYVPPSKKPSG